MSKSIQSYLVNTIKISAFLCSMLLLVMSCSKDAAEEKEEEQRYTGDSYNGLNSPFIHLSASLDKLHETRWDCINFGSYPQAEILDRNSTAVESYAIKDGDVIIDKELYGILSTAEWNNNETAVNGIKYRRMKGSDAINSATSRVGYYRWPNLDEYHYFRYEPVRWRILNITGSTALLMADKAMDCNVYHDKVEDVTWSECTLRHWLNNEMYSMMFSEDEKSSIIQSDVVNPSNHYFGTYCGENTYDNLFLLGEQDLFATDTAKMHGFYVYDGLNDPARRFRSSMYAKCRGAWISTVNQYQGNTFCFLRTNGYTQSNVVYICEMGYIYNRGTILTCNDSGILPVMRINLSTATYTPSGTVSSNDVVQK